MRGIYEISIDKYVYVGQAEVIEERQRRHLNRMSAGRHENLWVQRAFDKYGLDKDGWLDVLELVPDDEPLTPREQHWIDRRVTELGRERVMNLALAADCVFNDPQVIARRDANPQWRANNAAAMRSKSPEWQANNLAANVALRAKDYGFIDPTGERVEVYNLAAFCRERGLDKTHMYKVALGKVKSHKGWTKGDD
jgi:hypothetical protein